MKLQINYLRYCSYCGLIVLLLVILHSSSLLLQHSHQNRITDQLTEWFSMDGEGNFPALFSALLLLFAAFQFTIIARLTYQQRDNADWHRHWQVLALTFLFLAVDEAVLIHEKFDNNTLLSFVNTSGLLAWPWVILYGGLVLVFVAVFFKFWWALPVRYRVMYFVCAVTYVSAALGFEMLGALVYTAHDTETLLYLCLMTLEEFLEMAAIVLLIFTSFSFLDTRFATCRVALVRE